MDKIKCPVCKRTDERVQLVYVPLGHGRFCEYICLECKVVFPFGSNKFGDITDVEQIKNVAEVNLRYEDNEELKKEEHEDFTEEIYCRTCKEQITKKPRSSSGSNIWYCDKCSKK